MTLMNTPLLVEIQTQELMVSFIAALLHLVEYTHTPLIKLEPIIILTCFILG